MIVGRNQSDSIFGYNFHIYADKSSDINEQFLYNSSYFISQKGNKTEHLNKNKSQKFKDSINLLLGNYSEILRFNPLMLYKTLINKNNIIVQKQNNYISSVPCYHYLIKQNDNTKIDLYFDAKTLSPIMMETVSKNKKSVFIYRNSEINPFSQINYFMSKVGFYNRALKKSEAVTNTVNMIGKTVENWKFPILNTKDTLFSEQLKGKIVLLEFTAIFCSPCRQAINEIMNPLEDKYKNRSDIAIISVFGFKNDKEKDVIDYCEKNKVQTKYVLYNAEELGKKFKLCGYPTFYILDKNGKIRYQEEGNYTDYLNILDMEINNLDK